VLKAKSVVTKYTASASNMVRDKNAVLDVNVRYTFPLPSASLAGDVAMIFFPVNQDMLRDCLTDDITKSRCFGFTEYRMYVVEILVAGLNNVVLTNITNGFYRKALDPNYYLEYYSNGELKYALSYASAILDYRRP